MKGHVLKTEDTKIYCFYVEKGRIYCGQRGGLAQGVGQRICQPEPQSMVVIR